MIMILGGVLLLCFIIYAVLNLSFSKINIYPQKVIKEYLNDKYFEEFKFIKQDYLVTDRYHIWILKFQDSQGQIFREYFYMRNVGESLASYKEYGRIWDTYGQVILEKKYDIELSKYQNKTEPEETFLGKHYIFMEAEGESIDALVETIGHLYETVLLNVKTTSGCMLICKLELKKEGNFIFDTGEIAEELQKDGENITKDSIKKYIYKSIEKEREKLQNDVK